MCLRNHIVWDSDVKKFGLLYSFHDDRVVSRRVRQVLRGKFCKRTEDHLLGLHEVYLHFVWGGPGLHVSLLWTARQEFCQSRQWGHQLVAGMKVDLRGNLEACQRLCTPNQSIGYLRIQSDTENLGRSGTIWQGSVVPHGPLVWWGVCYDPFCQTPWWNQQTRCRATLIQCTAQGVEDRD